ncbi:MAG: hypothetical protein P8X55_03510 [Desulfosarcinaceae bacterium]
MKQAGTGFLMMAALLLLASGCQTQHRIETVHKVEVAPMHITIDVNVKVDRALDDFFGDLDQLEGGMEKTGE